MIEMIKTSNSENKNFKDFREKQENTILKLIEESDYTPIINVIFVVCLPKRLILDIKMI